MSARELSDADLAASRRVLDAIAAGFGLKRSELLVGGRYRARLWPRQLAMYLVRSLGVASLPQIADLFGGFSHTTVLSNCRAVRRRFEESGQRDVLDALVELTDLVAFRRHGGDDGRRAA